MMDVETDVEDAAIADFRLPLEAPAWWDGQRMGDEILLLLKAGWGVGDDVVDVVPGHLDWSATRRERERHGFSHLASLESMSALRFR